MISFKLSIAFSARNSHTLLPPTLPPPPHATSYTTPPRYPLHYPPRYPPPPRPQRAVEMIMCKYREHVTKLINQNKEDRLYSQHIHSSSHVMADRKSNDNLKLQNKVTGRERPPPRCFTSPILNTWIDYVFVYIKYLSISSEISMYNYRTY